MRLFYRTLADRLRRFLGPLYSEVPAILAHNIDHYLQSLPAEEMTGIVEHAGSIVDGHDPAIHVMDYVKGHVIDSAADQAAGATAEQAISGATDQIVGTTLFGHHIPWVTLVRSVLREAELIEQGHTDFTTAATNASLDVGGSFVGASAAVWLLTAIIPGAGLLVIPAAGIGAWLVRSGTDHIKHKRLNEAQQRLQDLHQVMKQQVDIIIRQIDASVAQETTKARTALHHHLQLRERISQDQRVLQRVLEAREVYLRDIEEHRRKINMTLTIARTEISESWIHWLLGVGVARHAHTIIQTQQHQLSTMLDGLANAVPTVVDVQRDAATALACLAALPPLSEGHYAATLVLTDRAVAQIVQNGWLEYSAWLAEAEELTHKWAQHIHRYAQDQLTNAIAQKNTLLRDVQSQMTVVQQERRRLGLSG